MANNYSEKKDFLFRRYNIEQAKL